MRASHYYRNRINRSRGLFFRTILRKINFAFLSYLSQRLAFSFKDVSCDSTASLHMSYETHIRVRYCVSVNECERRLRPTYTRVCDWLVGRTTGPSLAPVVSLALFPSFLSHSPCFSLGRYHADRCITFGKVVRHCRLSLDSPPDKSGDREHLYLVYLSMHILRDECHAKKNSHKANRIRTEMKYEIASQILYLRESIILFFLLKNIRYYLGYYLDTRFIL